MASDKVADGVRGPVGALRHAHLAAAGHPIMGDPLYGPDKAAASKGRQRLALRARKLAFRDPFQRKWIRIEAPVAEFLREYGFDPVQ